MVTRSRTSVRILAASIIGLALSLAASAGTVTWNFNIQSLGADTFWTSPTAANPNADLYLVDWTITKLEVRVVIILPVWIDVTSSIPPEFRVGGADAYGPAPIVVYNDTLTYPDPPAPLTIQTNLEIGLNASGNGYLNMTDVVFGVAPSPPAPQGTQLSGIRIQGSVTVQDVNLCFGDMNCDGVVDFFDIDPLVLAFSGPDAYAAAYPNCQWLNGDVDASYLVDFFDIDPFVARLGATCD